MRKWSGVTSLAVGIFVLITIEELPIGVLPVMSAELGIPEGVAGLAVTVPGLVAAATSVTTPVLVRGLDRRLVLVLALLCVAASSLLTVLAPGFGVVLVARVLAGVSIGLYWAVLPIVAVGQVDPARHATALTLAFSGTGGALVLGVPLATWIGTHLGWREAFAVVGAAALVMALLVAVLVRPVRAAVPVTPAMMREAARERGVRHAVGLTLLLIVAQFATYSYVSPLLQEAGVPLGRTGLLLLLFGIAGMIGNVAIAPVIRRRGAPTAVLVVAAGLTLSLLAVAVLLRTPVAAVLLLPTWGLFAGAASVTIQSFVDSEAGARVEEGTALDSAAFNVSIALGAALGGILLETAGRTGMLAVSVLLGAAGTALVARYRARPGPRTA
ncbi:arabinose ABC transporter permease [Brachybacterium sp. SGAir0954]|uniref:MFS transporter n=1 Tax=Brachybacterium sp. SGAir0954 TaxID=2571029 RepID=UPI0010CCB390|nr:MFS transporter [Brachybacterium sp. SGAir0954]QCR53504.1 arabinose ABC transporter permease [Brachybacterium sp. SGAir0954]